MKARKRHLIRETWHLARPYWVSKEKRSAWGLLLAVVVPKGFFPQQDTGLLVGVTAAPPDVSFESMMARQRQAPEVSPRSSKRSKRHATRS